MCELLSVSRSEFNAARVRGPSQRAQDDEKLIAQVRQVQRRHRGCDGRRRMTAEVREAQGRAVNEKRVVRVMRAGAAKPQAPAFPGGDDRFEETAASQFRGGIVMGLGLALMEEMQFDERSGRIMTRAWPMTMCCCTCTCPKST